MEVSRMADGVVSRGLLFLRNRKPLKNPPPDHGIGAVKDPPLPVRMGPERGKTAWGPP